MIVLCSGSIGAMAEPTAGRWEATHCCSPWVYQVPLGCGTQCGWLQHSFPWMRRTQCTLPCSLK